MKRTLLPYAMLALAIAACQSSPKPNLAPEAIYDNAQFDVITSWYNTTQQTMSTLYGNTEALHSATDTTGHVAGEQYRLVTWQQKPNPLWFGSNINGDIKTIEHLITRPDSSGALAADYTLVLGEPDERVPFVLNTQQRIQYILDQRASMFP